MDRAEFSIKLCQIIIRNNFKLAFSKTEKSWLFFQNTEKTEKSWLFFEKTEKTEKSW
jgi:hypothetical protein